MIASGTETTAAQKARNSVFHSRAADRGGDVLAAGQRGAEIAGQNAAEPAEIADIGRIVEAEFGAQIGERLRRGRLAEDGLRDVAGQDLRAGEDQDRNGQQEEDAQRDALGNQFQDG